MGNPVFAHPGMSDAAALTAGSEAATLPGGNLQRPQPGKVWRSAGLTDTWIVLDFGAARSWDWIAWVNANFTAAATIRARASDSEAALTSAPGWDSTAESWWPATGRPTVDEDEPEPEGYTLIKSLIGAPKTFRYLRLDISDPANPAGYVQAGRLVVGKALQLVRCFSWGTTFGRQDQSLLDQAIGGQLHGTSRPSARYVDFSLEWVQESEARGYLEKLDRIRGRGRDVMVCLDPDATTHLQAETLLGHMTEQPAFRLSFVAQGVRHFARRYRIQESPA